MICPNCGKHSGCASSNNLRVLCSECVFLVDNTSVPRYIHRQGNTGDCVSGSDVVYDLEAWERLREEESDD